MKRIFNTEFEISLKILLLLSTISPEIMTTERIVYYDFIASYGFSFSVYNINLNGDNSYRFEEIGARRTRCIQAIKSLVLDGLISVKRSREGFKYSINENGANVVKALSSEYAKQYRAAVKGTHDKYCMFSDAELIKEINQKALQLIRGEQNVF